VSRWGKSVKKRNPSEWVPYKAHVKTVEGVRYGLSRTVGFTQTATEEMYWAFSLGGKRVTRRD